MPVVLNQIELEVLHGHSVVVPLAASKSLLGHALRELVFEGSVSLENHSGHVLLRALRIQMNRLDARLVAPDFLEHD